MHRALLLALGACGRVAFAPIDVDGGAITPDAACTFGAWGPPTRIPTASTTDNEWGGQITADGLAYYYTSYAGGDGQPFVVRRPTRSDPFGPATLIAELDTAGDESEQSPSADELEVYFSSDRGVGMCIYRARRDTTSQPFGEITRLDSLCGVGDGASGPYLSHDGLRLYYHTLVTFPYGTVMMATRSSRSELFTPGVVVIPDAELRGFVSLTADELVLHYEAGDNHHQYVLERSSRTTPFAVPAIEMPGIGQAADRASKFEDGSITADGREFFFSSNRAGTSGNDDSWFVARDCL